MSDNAQAYTYEVMWTALTDACPNCQALNGETWTVPSISGVLSHPMFGDVYDLDADLSLTHPNCRCYLQITPLIDLEKTEYFQEIQNAKSEFDGNVPSNIGEAKQQVQDMNEQLQIGSGSIRMWEFALLRLGHDLEKLHLGKDVDEVIQKILRVIIALRQLQIAVYATEAATGPIGLAYAGITWFAAMIAGTTAVAELG